MGFGCVDDRRGRLRGEAEKSICGNTRRQAVRGLATVSMSETRGRADVVLGKTYLDLKDRAVRSTL